MLISDVLIRTSISIAAYSNCRIKTNLGVFTIYKYYISRPHILVTLWQIEQHDTQLLQSINLRYLCL